METGIRLIRLPEERSIAFKEEMQEVFEHCFQGHKINSNPHFNLSFSA